MISWASADRHPRIAVVVYTAIQWQIPVTATALSNVPSMRTALLGCNLRRLLIRH
ncbi:hypothetical protein DPMN_181148 [Dreissena polymorpha]|uniref:Uncharacterized protein n=1 Tax=Dreissena polymorpha TaxID=45954 RepID=A0A9D4DCZ0_DREPO|nr:hypothetical protein DPMN_181148 [Dreissena polymorpha]